MMIIQSARFGAIEVTETEIYRFPLGIPGFPDENLFVQLPYEQESPFAFLQSASEPDLCFLLVNPFAFFPEYEFSLTDGIAAELSLNPENPPLVFLIATIREKIDDMTVNQLAPLVFNVKERTGRQIILEHAEYSLRRKLFPDGLLPASGKGGE